MGLLLLLAGCCSETKNVQPTLKQALQGGNAPPPGSIGEIAGFETIDTTVSPVRHNGSPALLLRTGHKEKWPGLMLYPANGKWDAGEAATVEMDVINTGNHLVEVGFRLDNPGGNGTSNSVQIVQGIPPGQTRTMTVELATTGIAVEPETELVSVRRAPGIRPIDPANITRMIVFAEKPEADHMFTISKIRTHGKVKQMTPAGFFPFIDPFGQYIHGDWRGKTHVESALTARRKAEAKELTANPGPAERDPYGGWTKGPQLAATGWFRVEKRDGKWWLVDPEGHLFWSYGMTTLGVQSPTPTTGRRHYFADLDGLERRFPECVRKDSWAPGGYYAGKSYEVFDYGKANLMRKYGPGWAEAADANASARLQSWGFNTVACWSQKPYRKAGKMPYTGYLQPSGTELRGSTGYWRKFHDVFDPAFVEGIRKSIKRNAEEMRDPWCIGFFADNELSWGEKDHTMALFTLASPADQPAKIEFAKDLKAKYGDIGKLNEAWGSAYTSWDGFMQTTNAPPIATLTMADLLAFSEKTVVTYFRTIRDELKSAAPNHLYLGCRFAGGNDLALRAATRFCDVVSYNRYAYSVEKLDHPAGAGDKPIIIGEFHFGANDRGLFNWGLTKAFDQADRAGHLKAYVDGALRNPRIVGAHWFQYADEPATGRGDGENLQAGFVDICDTPYPETVQASRELAEELYLHRLAGK